MAQLELEKPQTSNYFFPDFLAKLMSKVDIRTQYEASMMSMSFMSLGLIVTIVYLIIYFDFALWYKIFLGINGFFGLMFMWSGIVTTFQSYKSLLEIIEFQKNDMKGGKENAETN